MITTIGPIRYLLESIFRNWSEVSEGRCRSVDADRGPAPPPNGLAGRRTRMATKMRKGQIGRIQRTDRHQAWNQECMWRSFAITRRLAASFYEPSIASSLRLQNPRL
jgi:hypothetical protein